MTGPRRVHLVIQGRVQGVFFRDSALRQAQELGISGWVRNLPDGRVEAQAQGTPEAVETFITWCRAGPPAARVDDVRIQEMPPQQEPASFEVRR